MIVDHDAVFEPGSTDDVESVLEGVIELREIGEEAHDPQTGDETQDVERPQAVRSSSIEPVRENGGLVWLYFSYCASISLARAAKRKNWTKRGLSFILHDSRTFGLLTSSISCRSNHAW